MTEYNVTINKLPGELITHPAFPIDKVCRTTFINYAEPREIPDWLKRHLLKIRVHESIDQVKYLKYAEISLDKSQNCVYSSIRLDGKYIAIGTAVYLDSGELDIHKINIFVYTLPDMELVMDTVHELNEGINIELVGPDIMFFNGGILWQDADNTCKYEIVKWHTYRLCQYNGKVRDMLYINGPDGKNFIYEYGFPRNTNSKYKYVWGRNKAHLDVYMNVLDAEPGITDGLFNKYSLGSGPPDFTGGIKTFKKCMLECMFRELPPELITGILGYIPIEDKLELLLD